MAHLSLAQILCLKEENTIDLFAPPCPAHFSKTLLSWYAHNKRTFPWRAVNGTPRNPYFTVLSEFLLQQTRTSTVVPYFLRYIERFPTLEAMALAPREEILSLFAGLGYYRRAHNMHACMQAIHARFGGAVPSDVSDLLSLPGIGAYTAAAIASIAYDIPQAVVDGNVIRIIARMFGLRQEKNKLQNPVTAITKTLTPRLHAGDFAQAMMDFGTLVCTPKSPKCSLCPFAKRCYVLQNGMDPQAIPKRVAKPKKTRQAISFCFLQQQQCGAITHILLRQKQEAGLFQGLWEMPWIFAEQAPDQETAILCQGSKQLVSCAPPVIQHTLTHFTFHMQVQVYRLTQQGLVPNAYRLVRLEEAQKLGISSLVQKIITAIKGIPPIANKEVFP